MIEQTTQQSIVRIVASEKSWIEGEAVRQLNNTASLDNMKIGVGLPDLHPGRGTPVGAAFYSNHMIYPHIVGSDVGCGIGLWQTSLKTSRVKRDKWAEKLINLHHPWNGDVKGLLQSYGLESVNHATQIGTIGSGNHFAELQRVEDVHCQKGFLSIGLDRKNLFLLVHSGSRGIGEALLRKHTDQYGARGLPEESESAQHYLAMHNLAVKWAKCNRSLIAQRFVDKLKSECNQVLDLCHNSVGRRELDGVSGWLHRKGAAPSDQGILVIPGSRGSLSYLVEPIGEQSFTLWSLAHGAGRKWNRKSCKGRLSSQFSPKSLTHTTLGSVVICDDRDLLYEEAPQAYKNIAPVIHDMVREGLIRVIATLRPLITYKKRSKS